MENTPTKWNLLGKFINEYGDIVYCDSGIVDLLLSGKDVNEVNLEDSPELQKHNDLCGIFDQDSDKLVPYKKPDISVEDFDFENQNHWYIPEEYLGIDILDFLLKKCTREEEIERVELEYQMFKDHGMEMVLRLMIYLVDTFRKNNIVWGVGRGSSVSSYILFLIGIHKVDSIRYSLDPGEFLK